LTVIRPGRVEPSPGFNHRRGANSLLFERINWNRYHPEQEVLQAGTPACDELEGENTVFPLYPPAGSFMIFVFPPVMELCRFRQHLSNTGVVCFMPKD
jgi:hypothetical protein